jgi:hypothetical protein
MVTRFRALDSWRGVCALMVALFHFPALGWLYGLPLVRHAWLFVDFFFVLSGFVISHAYAERLTERIDGFLIRRVGRIWPLHLALIAGFAALELTNLAAQKAGLVAGREAFTQAYDPFALLANLELVNAFLPTLTWNYPSWSISAELAAYVSFALAVRTLGNRAVWLAAVIVPVCAVVLLFTPDGMASNGQFGVVRCLLGFWLGFATYRLWRKTGGPAAHHTAWEVATALAAVLLVSFADRHGSAFAAPFIFALLVWVYAREGGAVSRLLNARPVLALGERSYSIYMLHALFGTVLIQTADLGGRFGLATGSVMSGGLRMLAFGSPWMMDTLALAYLSAVVFAAGLTLRHVERPGQAWFRRLECRAAVDPEPLPARVDDQVAVTRAVVLDDQPAVLRRAGGR